MNNRQLNIPVLLIMSLILSGCELLGPKLHKKRVLDDLEQNEKSAIIYPELSNEGAAHTVGNQPRVELYPGTGHFISSAAQKAEAAKISEKGQYSLNFDGADLAEVVNVILSDILAENYVFSPKVSGTVTLQTTRPLAKTELLPTLEMLLGINNAALVLDRGMYRIKPVAAAVNGSVLIAQGQQLVKGYQIKVVPVMNVAVAELAAIVKPLLKEETLLHVENSRNMLLIAGTASELSRAMEIVNIFDVDVMNGRSFGLFPLTSVAAGKVMEELEQIFNQKGKTSELGFIQFMEIERLNAILAIVHQAKSLKDIERWVYRLDRANTTAGGGANVYRVQHVDAVVLAATLNEIFAKNDVKKNQPVSIAAGRKSVEVTNKKRNFSAKAATAVVPRNVADSARTTDLGEVKIIAVEVNNALVIVATAQDYAVVYRVIEQLDVMPLQVLIDTMIVEVALTDNLEYGIKWALSHNNGQNAASSNGGVFLSNAAAIATTVVTGGFGYAFVSNDVSAVLEAEALKNNLNVISSPSLMVLNNQEASIQVGDEISLITSESTNISGGDTNVVTSTIQQRKTGVTVIVKPRVNANGLVIMEIEQRFEEARDNGSNGNPDILTREIKSSVAVQSGETIVLGGLISEKIEFIKSGIPFLHELPLIGPLFGQTTKNKRKTELVVLITPRVVNTRQDARLVTDEFKRKLSGIYDFNKDESFSSFAGDL